MKKTCFLTFLLLITAFLSACVQPFPAKPTANSKEVVAIIPVSNRAEDQKIAEMLTTALKKSDYFLVADRNRIKKVIQEQRLQRSGLINEATMAKLGNILNARYLVYGEIVSTERDQSSTSVSIALSTSIIMGKVYDLREKRLKAVASETGRGMAGGLGVDVKTRGKTQKELLGVQRSVDDMDNTSFRSAVESLSNSIIRGVYGKNELLIDAEIKPDPKIENWSREHRHNQLARAEGRLFLVPYHAVWNEVRKYFEGDIAYEDMNKGIIATREFSPGGSVDRRQVYVFLERGELNSTKMTVKAFCYSFRDRDRSCRMGDTRDRCYELWAPWMGSNVYAKRLTKAVRSAYERENAK